MVDFDPAYKQHRDDGRQANMSGVARNLCPYMPEIYPSERDHWLAGWDEGQGAQNKGATFGGPVGGDTQ